MAKRKPGRPKSKTTYKKQKPATPKRKKARSTAKRVVRAAKKRMTTKHVKGDMKTLLKYSLSTLAGLVAIKQANKFIPVKNQYVKAGIPLAVGAALFFGMKKNDLAKMAGISMVAGGLFNALPLIPGLENLAGDDGLDYSNPETAMMIGEEIQNFIPEAMDIEDESAMMLGEDYDDYSEVTVDGNFYDGDNEMISGRMAIDQDVVGETDIDQFI